MKKKLLKRAAFLPFVVLLLILSSCFSLRKQVPSKTQSIPLETKQPQETTKPKDSRLNLIAVGDNLIHNTVIRAAKTEGGRYDFTSMYAPVKNLIKEADVAFVNQEAPLATDIYAASGYPNFNAPQEVGLDLIKEGFNIINQANNHAMDKGYKAVLSTVEFWKSQSNILMTGMYDSEKDRKSPKILEKNGIKIGVLSYTYGTNGIFIPSDMPYLVSLINKDRIKSDISALRKNCDVLIVSMHWGVEYNLGVTDEQKDLARFLTEQGADLIIGHHPHVIEPAEWIETDNGKKSFCIYSLGNFISSQQKRVTMLGGMLRVTIKKNGDGKITLENPGIVPLVTHYEKNGKNYRVYPLNKYSDDLAKKHAVNDYDNPVSVAYFKNMAQEVFGNYVNLNN